MQARMMSQAMRKLSVNKTRAITYLYHDEKFGVMFGGLSITPHVDVLNFVLQSRLDVPTHKSKGTVDKRYAISNGTEKRTKTHLCL